MNHIAPRPQRPTNALPYNADLPIPVFLSAIRSLGYCPVGDADLIERIAKYKQTADAALAAEITEINTWSMRRGRGDDLTGYVRSLAAILEEAARDRHATKIAAARATNLVPTAAVIDHLRAMSPANQRVVIRDGAWTGALTADAPQQRLAA